MLLEEARGAQPGPRPSHDLEAGPATPTAALSEAWADGGFPASCWKEAPAHPGSREEDMEAGGSALKPGRQQPQGLPAPALGEPLTLSKLYSPDQTPWRTWR